MLSPVVRPLLITPGQCAKFGYEGLEDLTDLQAVKPPSELHHRLHLSLWFVSKNPQSRSRKLSERALIRVVTFPGDISRRAILESGYAVRPNALT